MTSYDPGRDEVRRELEERVAGISSAKRVRWRLGRRGAFLVLMGVLYMGLAYLYATTPLPPFLQDQLSLPINVMKVAGAEDADQAMQWWAVAWGVSGLVAAVTAWWPPGKDHWGFIALWVFSAVWSVLNLYSGVVLGAPRAAVTGVVYAIYAATVVIVSGMPDPTPISKVVAGDDES